MTSMEFTLRASIEKQLVEERTKNKKQFEVLEVEFKVRME